MPGEEEPARSIQTKERGKEGTHAVEASALADIIIVLVYFNGKLLIQVKHT